MSSPSGSLREIFSEELSRIRTRDSVQILVFTHRQADPDALCSASGLISLTQDSRDWILNTLSIQYPEAYIHQPFFSFGGSGCSWSSAGNAQIDDPGTWTISVMGRTSGTPVSGPRGFSGGGSPFDVWLKEVEIIK